MKKEILFVETEPHGRPHYVYREHEGRWVFWRKLKQKADAKGCVSEKLRVPSRVLYIGDVHTTELSN